MYVSPQKDNGYDVADYYNIDPRMGTMEDFDNLVVEAKKRNIDIMLDMVFNHTSTEHEWFKKAMKGEKNIKTSIYLKKEKIMNLQLIGFLNLVVMHGNMWRSLTNTIFIYLM